MANPFRSSLVRDASRLLSANVAAQVIGLLVYPLLSRLYSPSDFGLLNVFVSIGGILIVIANMEWHYAIVLPKDDDKAKSIVRISLATILIVSVLVALTIPFAPIIAGWMKTPSLSRYYWLLPMYVLFSGIWNVLNYWFIRYKQYGSISGYQISSSLFSAGYKSMFGAIGATGGGLIYSTVLMPLSALTIQCIRSWKEYISPIFRPSTDSCERSGILTHDIRRSVFDTRLIKEYKYFPLYSLPRNIINIAAAQLPVLLLTPVFSVEQVGYWGMAYTLAFTPIIVIIRSLYQVLYQKTNEMIIAKRSISRYFRKYTLLALAIIIPVFTVLYFILPSLTEWLLGTGWRRTGELIRLMLPWIAVNVLSSSTIYLVDIFFKQKQLLIFEIWLALMRILGIIAGIWLNSFTAAIAFYCLSNAIVNIAEFIWMIVLVQQYEKTIDNA